MADEIILRKWGDPHFHPREDDMITRMVLRDLEAAGACWGVPIFNFRHPMQVAWQVEDQLKRLKSINPRFALLPSIMLTQFTTPDLIYGARSIGVKVIKWIPNGLSTNSGHGVGWEDIHLKYACLEKAEQLGMYFMVHVEDSEIDKNGNPITPYVQRESLAIPRFDALVRDFPGIWFSMEHVSTKRGIDYILNQAPPNVRGGLTLHHMIGRHWHVYDKHGRIIPDQWCMPVFKESTDAQAVIRAAISGDPRFFYGSDRAPHRNKNPKNPPAGIYHGRWDACLLAEIFELYRALDKLDDFLSGFASMHYGVPRSQETFRLVRREQVIPEEIDGVCIFCGGQKVGWTVEL